MTYQSNYTTYEFTAFSESDLVSGNLTCGSTFTMPANASACISVTDNDAFMSGDNKRNENANDRRGQEAAIEIDGEEAGNGGQIYAESYYWVCDQHGNWYVMIEVEQEGTNDDYFTFFNGYGYETPPEGAELTVYSQCNVTSNWVDFKCLDAGEKAPEFVECDDPNAVKIDFEAFAAGTEISEQYEGVTIEAQRNKNNTDENDAMVFDSSNPTGGDTDLATSTQGNVLIISEDNDSSDPDDAVGGSVTFTFDNPATIYDIKVIDTEEGGTITLRDADGNVVGTFDIPRIGDGDIDQVLMGVEGVSSMTVELNGSGAIDDLCYVPQPVGSLSGKYFCDENDNGVDDEANNGVEGVTVLLFDESFNLVGETATDADGNYSFEGLVPGSYNVKFCDDVSGKDLVDANVGNDDSIDSDAISFDETTSTISNIVVVANQNTPDNDAGVVDNTIATQDDTAETCYDDAVKVDVTANDSDPQSQTLTVTAVNGQAITEGGAPVVIGGVAITLVAGELCFDGSSAYADLVAGENDTVSFTYTVSDGENTAEADVDVTFKGATDTVEKVKAELPEIASVQIIQESSDVGNGVSSDAFTIQFTDAGDLNGVFENAYCVDFFDPIDVGGHGTSISDAPLVGANLTIATADCLTDEQAAELGSGGVNGESAVDNLDLINWIINQDFENTDNGDGAATNYTDAEIQGAIWALTNGDTLEGFGVPGGVFVEGGLGTASNGQEILDLAIANGEGFVAGEGDLVGVLVDPVSPDSSVQPFIVAMDLYEECVC